ncbi:MAG: bifunctional pyr operon transcriptional regulator/uracil phosphoribosyltransferase PyrR [Burkholderiaceae bacterium]|jgi:pyrimidine operon attenuation protein/uracil phosphoribosyltransferase|nr:bifunctional pyr operon transcriptional regulator/uracil phosphoribosyltransferase PyrR [Burkholderiaceae bacterium]
MTHILDKLDAEALYRTLLQKITVALPQTASLQLAGIRSGGAWIAERMARDLHLPHPPGFIDVSFYRDDYAQKGLHAAVQPTSIPFDVDKATILLIDDVLYTGRTTRAAINELFDYGRPDKIMLAALIDRGGRELPVSADFVSLSVFVPQDQTLVLHRTDENLFDMTVEHA